MTAVKFNKIVTIVTDNRVFAFKKKSDFWFWASTQDSFVIDANTAKSQIVNKLNALGFDFQIDDSWGFDFDFRITAKKN
jgi:hypothetical protein